MLGRGIQPHLQRGERKDREVRHGLHFASARRLELAGAKRKHRSSILDLRLTFFIGGPDENEAAIRPGDSPFNEEEMVVGIDLDDA